MPVAGPTVARALESRGESSDPIYAAAAAALRARGAAGTLVDLGCGTGRFRAYAETTAATYVGVDVVRYAGLPRDVTFVQADLDREPAPLGDACADIVAAIETIEHLENPRAFLREAVRLLRPAGTLVVSTPNQLSALSLLCLATKGRFAAFQDAAYPAHRTALLPVDLARMAGECGLVDIAIGYSASGRIPLTAVHYPALLSHALPRWCSDTVILTARKHA